MNNSFLVDVKNKTTELKHKFYTFGSSVTTLSTKTLATNLTLCEEFNLSIDLKMSNRSTSSWTKVFSLQIERSSWSSNWSNKGVTAGSSILGVSTRTDQSNVMLMITYKNKNKKNYNYTMTTKINANNWINLKINQISRVYQIFVNYKLVYNTRSVPKTWANLDLVMGNTNGNSIIGKRLAIVQYRNFEIKTCPVQGKSKVLKYK